MPDEGPTAAQPPDGAAPSRRLLLLLFFSFLGAALLTTLGSLASQAPGVHRSLQALAAFTALLIFLLAAAKYIIGRERVYFWVSLAFLAAGLSALLQPLVSSFHPEGTAAGAQAGAWIDFLGRTAWAAGLLVTVRNLPGLQLDDRPVARLVRSSGALAGVVLVVVVWIGGASPPLYPAPGAAGVSWIDVLPLAFIVGAIALLVRQAPLSARAVRAFGGAALVLALAGNASYLMSGGALALPLAGHLLMLVAYSVVLFGLFVDHARLYTMERGLRQSMETAHADVKTAKTELDTIIQELTDGVAIADERGRLVRINRAAKEILGRELVNVAPDRYAETYQLETTDGRPFPPQEFPIARALRSGKRVHDVEMVVTHPSGERRHLVAGAVPIRDGQGRIRGAAAAFSDVTQIRVAEQRFRDLTESAPDGIIVVDERWRIVLFNAAAERMLGYTRVEVYGKDVGTLVTARLRPVHMEARAAAERGTALPAAGSVPFRLLHKDGREVPVEVSMSTSESTSGKFYIAHVRDATQRERLRREREGILSIAQAATGTHTVPDFLARAASSVVEATQFDACLIYTHDVPRHALVLAANAGFPDDLAEEHRQYPLDPNFPTLAVQTWFRREIMVEADVQARTERPMTPQLAAKHGFRLVLSSVFGEPGEPQGVLQLVARDTRPRREDDEQLLAVLAHELTAGLRQKRLIQQLEEGAQDLRAANRELDSFIYTASHDLAEPLRSISNFSHFLLEDYQQKLDEQGQDYLQRVHQGAIRMKRLLDDLLRLSRQGRSTAPKVRVLPEEVMDEVREALDAMLTDRHVRLQVLTPLPAVVADRTSLVEVLSNLVANAVKFNDQAVPTVDVSAERRDGMVEFAVRDNGIGIAPEHHERIFSLFTRLHPRRDYPGTGAGLAIVKKIIEMHDGKVWVESDVGKGATFRFTLAAAPAPRLEVPEARAAKA